MSRPYSSSSPSSADLDLIQRRVIPELDKGRGFAEQLLGQLQFRRPPPAAAAKPDVTVELVQEVMRCFTSAISVLMEPFGGWSAFQKASENQENTAQVALVNDKRKKPQEKERRRKTKGGETREIIKSDGYAIHDSYSWRKYGEKYINGYDFPREYFRCAHQGCPATKRVQKIQDGNPGLCLVTCHSEHSCILADAKQERCNDQNNCYQVEVKEERDVLVEPSTSRPFEAQKLATVSTAMLGMQTISPVECRNDISALMLLQANEVFPMHVLTDAADQGTNLWYGYQPSPRGPLDFMLVDEYYPELEHLSAYLASNEFQSSDNLWF